MCWHLQVLYVLRLHVHTCTSYASHQKSLVIGSILGCHELGHVFSCHVDLGDVDM